MATTMNEPLDLEDIATRASNAGFHFGLSRTRCPRGKWEARFNPMDWTFWNKHDAPFGKDDRMEKAVKQAIAALPEEYRVLIEA